MHLVASKAFVDDPWDIAHIYGSLHCNHFSLHGKLIDCETTTTNQCACVTNSTLSFAGNDELVALEDFIDVGNVLYISYDRLWPAYFAVQAQVHVHVHVIAVG